MSQIGETFQDRLELQRKLTGKELTPTETIQAYADELCKVANDRDRLQRELASEKARIAQTVTYEPSEERLGQLYAQAEREAGAPEYWTTWRAFVSGYRAALQKGEKE